MKNNWPSILFAMAGRVVLSLGNLSTQYAWAFVGLSITEVIIASTTLNYFLDDKINRAEILFQGVACFLIVVCLASVVYVSNAKHNQAKLNGLKVIKLKNNKILEHQLNNNNILIYICRHPNLNTNSYIFL
uniref:Uncharacterized protein n=1 Tax=Lactuca sativa TaxID=4236 RepID=A0A9R1VD98_LACSA|nr:hypothetical protein LSAT_V11C500276330 [Lactuca sativa]